MTEEKQSESHHRMENPCILMKVLQMALSFISVEININMVDSQIHVHNSL